MHVIILVRLVILTESDGRLVARRRLLRLEGFAGTLRFAYGRGLPHLAARWEEGATFSVLWDGCCYGLVRCYAVGLPQAHRCSDVRFIPWHMTYTSALVTTSRLGLFAWPGGQCMHVHGALA